jgi:hypothetical protein
MTIQLSDPPIFVIGAERSGTTLLMTILGCHPRIAVPEVAWFYPRFYPYLHTYGDLSDPDRLRTLTEELIFGLKTSFWGVPVNPRTIVDEILEHLPELSFGGLYAAVLGWYADYKGKPRWGEKTPFNLFFIDAILSDFPNAQFIYLTRDGRDVSAEYLESSFGPTNIYSAATIWQLCQDTVKPWREKLSSHQWLDVRYETLVREPEKTIQTVCHFLGEPYDPVMLEFYQTDIAQRRAQARDHRPLGHPISDRYIGLYKDLLSLRDQRIFAGVAGAELAQLGYEVEVEPLVLSTAEQQRYEELDARIRAATLDAPDGHIVYESYNDWLADQRRERLHKGIGVDTPPFPLFTQSTYAEELITGQRAWHHWKTYFGIKRQYSSHTTVL